jgi:hypothetical protein
MSRKNIQQIPWDKKAKTFEAVVCERSENADLVILGFSLSKLTEEQGSFFMRFSGINDILFVRTGEHILVSDDFLN